MTLWTTTCHASLSFTTSQSLLKFMSIESIMSSNHLILCGPLLLPPSVFLNIRVFSNESAVRIRGPKYWSFRFSISPYNEYSGLISFRMDWLDLLVGQGLGVYFTSSTRRGNKSGRRNAALWEAESRAGVPQTATGGRQTQSDRQLRPEALGVRGPWGLLNHGGAFPCISGSSRTGAASRGLEAWRARSSPRVRTRPRALV